MSFSRQPPRGVVGEGGTRVLETLGVAGLAEMCILLWDAIRQAAMPSEFCLVMAYHVVHRDTAVLVTFRSSFPGTC